MSDQGYNSYQPCTALYAGCIHEATRGGDRERMRAVEAQASQYVKEVREALEDLRSKLNS